MMRKSILDLDVRFTRRLQLSPESVFRKKLASFLAHSGDSWFWLAGLGLVWLFGTPVWQNLSAVLAISLVFQAVFVLALKFSIRRRRPEGEWGAIYRITDPHSFPSGHAARAGLLAVMALGLGPAWFGWLLVIWAPLVSYARILMGVHYLSDVVAGLLIGVLVGWIMLEIHQVLYLILPFVFV